MDFASREFGFKLVYVIIVICGINHGNMKLGDHFKLIHGGLDAYLIEHELGFS